MEVLIIIIVIVVFIILASNGSGGNQEPNRNSEMKNKYQGQSGSSYNITVSVEDITDNYRHRSDSLVTDFQKFWLSKDETVHINGYSFSEGMVYVGKNLASVGSDNYRTRIEPALIDPRREVNRQYPDYEGTSFGYWPSYRSIPPEARAAYLEWLAGDRSDPNTPIGYVFLYYYGLERRILHDSQHSTQVEHEIPQLAGEVRRLLSVYGDNRSFRGYATNLIEFLDLALQGSNGLKEAVQKEDLDFTKYGVSYYNLGLNFKKGLAYFAVQDKPLPAEWALKWALPHTSLRTPATRCKEKFQHLFKKRYEDKFGEGLTIKPGNRALRINYRPASHSFGYGSITQKTKIPEVPDQRVQINRITKLIEECTDRLDPYSRYLGRNPGDTDSVQALSNLPTGLLEEHLNPDLQEFIGRLDAKLNGERYAFIDTQHFTEYWNIQGVNKFRKQESIEIAQFLFKLGFGIEPDLRFGSAKFERDSQVVVFRIDPQEYPTKPSKEYKLALLILHLTTIVGLADGTLSPEEEQHLDEYIEELFQLSQQEKVRLDGYLRWLKAENPGVHGIKKKIKDLDSGKKESILEFLIKVANADGYIGPGEVEMLQKVAEIFELDADQVYTAIHAQQTRGEDPMLIVKGDREEGYLIPDQEDGSDELDEELINKTLKETNEVQDILSDIFRREEPGQSEHEPPQEEVGQTVLGLDQLHSKLVKKLLSKPEWTMMEYENLCSEFGVFPGGALEMINEKSYDEFDDVLLIEAEQIELNQEITNKLNL